MKVTEQHFNELSDRLSITAKRGLPMIVTGCLFWLVAGLAGWFLPKELTVWVYLFGIGCIFPVGMAIAKLMKVDMFAKGNPLASLAGVVGGMQILFAPVIVLILYQAPGWIPFTVGVLTGAHFLPFTLIYRSKAYLFLSVATVLTASATGFFAIQQSFLVTPFAVLAVYVITCALIAKENRTIAIRNRGISA